MVEWCRTCGAFMGLHPPLTDWTTDRTVLCPACLEAEERETVGVQSERVEPEITAAAATTLAD
jgi:hypothetical protein